MTSEEFSNFILDKAGVALLPGNNFGIYGDGYVRLCYVNSQENIELAIKKMRSALAQRNF
jgi:aspartate/methionine/tyrosine aminotransferase